MVKCYKFRATRNHPLGKPYASGSPIKLAFRSTPSLFSGEDALLVWNRITGNRPESGWIMEPADE